METPPFDAREERDRIAAGWAAALDSGPLAPDRERELANWLDEDPRHRGALVRAQAALVMLARPMSKAAPAAPRMGRRALLAGGVACAIGIGLFAVRDAPALDTGIGEIRRTPMADGSSVVLDTATTLRPRFSTRRREMRLDRGRALFSVAHDAARPFIVEADGIRVRAIGTVFSVSREDTVEVLVTEGVVEVTGGSRAEILRAGQRGRFTSGGIAAIEAVPAATMARALDWRDGRLELDGQTLASAVATINRYNRRPIVVTDPALAGEPLHGAFRNDDPEGFARSAAIGLGARSWAEPDRIVIGR